ENSDPDLASDPRIPAPFDPKGERNHIRHSLSACEKFNSLLEQVFLYITNRCGLRCEQCFYKSELNNVEMPLAVALFHAQECAKLGATKITLLGGEPSLYDLAQKWHNLKALVSALPSFGYKTIRIDTNGQFEEEFIDAITGLPITELSFSLDGGSAVQNDQLRGVGVFERVVTNIRRCLHSFRVSVTICVGRANLATLTGDVRYLSSVGVRSLNFHPLLCIGNRQDEYIRQTAITAEEWRSACSTLLEMRAREKQLAPMRVPPRFTTHPITTAENYCSLRRRDRVHIHPNGQLRICPLTVGTPYLTAHTVNDRLKFVEGSSEAGQLDNSKVCAFQRIIADALEPLCVSYKPA
ncbi:MAG: radical SAM protein, partial [Hyphomicrobiaceae bacterium]